MEEKRRIKDFVIWIVWYGNIEGLSTYIGKTFSIYNIVKEVFNVEWEIEMFGGVQMENVM